MSRSINSLKMLYGIGSFLLLVSFLHPPVDAEETKKSTKQPTKVIDTPIGKKNVSSPSPEKYCLNTETRRLPGSLNNTPCFNSNSPELVLTDGILLSTFPPEGMAHPEAHLNYAFNGEFDIFSHHVTRSETAEDDRTLFIGFVVRNPNNKTVRMKVLSGASYLSQPDAPFVTVPELSVNDDGNIYAGPGDRATNDVLRKRMPPFLDKSITLSAGQEKLLLVLPLPVRQLRPALNGRSTLIKLKTSAPIYVASLARFIHQQDLSTSGSDEVWLKLLNNSPLCTPRDELPTVPGSGARIKYGRVSGVSKGTKWSVMLSDNDALNTKLERSRKRLGIPASGNSITYPFCTVEGGTFGTSQIQSAGMVVRYPDTAYMANGNYGIMYRLQLPLYNPDKEAHEVQILFQSALKSNNQDICFYESAPPRAFYRGTVRVTNGNKDRYWHLVQRQGTEGAKIAELKLNAGGRKQLLVEFLYPPDATPPQELCIKTIATQAETD